ncbi:Ig-like domain-containing protein, partial [Shewanella sp. 1_MG-2023]|uniref:Ig-like domain-containing protein n=1 Tax=unclassified Shewanella TaxID=196818 RepID=UPI0026E3F47C
TIQIITGVTVDANGDYSIDGVDISGLVDGDITVDAQAVDQNGQTVTNDDTDNMDATPGSIDVALVINDGAETADISGTTTDVAPNSTVTLTLTDSAGTVQIITGVTVDANGDYSIDGVDISGLVDGDITVDASAVDQNGQTVTDADTDNMDATAGSIDVALVINDGAETADISGTTTDVAPNSTVTLTLTDSAGTVQIITGVTVDANGDYSIDGVDISSLVDGDITVDASAEDRNGNTVVADAIDNLDATSPTLDITIADASLEFGESTLVTFTFSEKVTNFNLTDDIIVNGGTLSGLVSNDGGETWTATFTPTDGYSGSASITVNDDTYTDLSGNLGSGDSESLTIADNTVDAVDDVVGTIFSTAADSANNWISPVNADGEADFVISARNADGTTGVLTYNEGTNQLGVDGSPRTSGQIANQIEYDSATGTSEAIVIDFNGLVNEATFTVSKMFADENSGEQGTWYAYYNGQLVASETFTTTEGTTGTFTINTGNIVFDQLVFEAAPTISEENGGSPLADSSDYYLDSVTVTGPALVDAFVVQEDQTLVITDIADGLLANDTDAQGHSFNISHINGTTFTPGQAVTLTSGAIVTINANGTYTYDVNGAFDSLTAGELDTDTFTYTITDQYGAVDTATVTINIVGVNNAPEPVTDNFAIIENELLTFTTDDLINNDNDAENDTLTVSGFAPDASDTSMIDANEGGASFTTALGGTITINADGTYSYQAPSLIHNAGDVIVDTFYYQVTDGTGNSSWTAITIDVTDTAPTAVDDLDSIGFGGTAYGNVITGAGTDGSGVDTIGADATTVKSVSFDNTTYSNFDSDGNLTIVTDKGILIVNQDGSYTYESTQTDTIAESFDYNDLLNSNGISLSGINDVNSLDLTNLDAPGTNIGSNGSRLGVGGNVINNSEAMIIDLGTDDNFTEATIGLNGVNGSDVATWTAYAADGTTVVATGSTTNNSINIISNTAFQYIVLTAGNGSYGLNSLTATSVGDGVLSSEDFNYILEDIDGDTSEATLTVNQDSTPIADTDSQTVSEAGLVEGTEEGSNSHIATGNLLDNDSGVSASTLITSIDGQSATNGIITINTANGTLTVYTEDGAGIRAGDYQYELTNTNNTSTDLLESFNYIIENSSGDSSNANLDITIVDDMPIANDVTQNLQTISAPIATNLTFVLDVSGSMDGNAGNGKTYLETAVESLTALINEVDKTGNVNIQIITYSSGTANSGWLLDDIDGAINYLNSLVAGGGTNYAAAINTVMNSGDIPTGSDQDFVYFISDGVPTGGQSVDTDLQSEWQTYVQDNYDISFGIGIGNAVLDALLPISFPEVDGNEEYAIVVDDADDLTSTILNYFDNSTIVGDLGLLAGNSTTGVLIGADGGRVDTVIIDGVTYTYDPANPEQILTTDFGGIFTINFETGEYNYFIEVNKNIINEQETIEVQVVDNDGDTGSLSLIIELDYYAGLDANVNNIITNQADGSTLNIDAAYLTHGDATPDSAAITSVDGGATLANGVVTLDNANDGDSFNYTLEGNGASDSAEVTVDYQTSTTLTGTHENDIIIGKSTQSGTQAIVNATVKSGNTYNATNQFGFEVAALAAGLSVTQIQIDLRAGTDGNATFDISDTTIAVGSDSVGITDSASDIFAAMTSDNSVLTMNFTDGDFSSGDSFWFAFDTDSLGNDVGSDLAAQFVTFTITLSDGSSQTATYVDDGQSGSSGQVYFSDSVLDGGAGDDVLIAGDGNDLLIGGEGDDLLIGGLGDDLLIGGDGNDTYTWLASEMGNDVIEGFDINSDTLDLSDLLQGENTDNLSDFLSLSFADGNTTISIDADNDNVVDQVIVLNGVDLSDANNYSTTDDGVIINGLLDDGALIVDTEPAVSAQSSAFDPLDNAPDGNIIP